MARKTIYLQKGQEILREMKSMKTILNARKSPDRPKDQLVNLEPGPNTENIILKL